MKARIPKHREFIINLAEDYEKKDECWDKLQEIMEQAGELDERVPFDKVVDNSFGEKVTQE